MSITIPGWRYEEIKRTVVDLFVKFDVHCVPVSGFELAAKMGIKVIPYSAYSSEIQLLLRKESEDGFLILRRGEYFIFYNDELIYGRINHTLLHEIGHVVLGHIEESQLAEKEAGFFAKYALVPPVLVHKLKLNNPSDIADIFEVSFEAANYALSYYHKWLQYGKSDYTDYEITLLNLFNVAA